MLFYLKRAKQFSLFGCDNKNIIIDFYKIKIYFNPLNNKYIINKAIKWVNNNNINGYRILVDITEKLNKILILHF